MTLDEVKISRAEIDLAGELEVDGIVTPSGAKLWGVAKKQEDGTWRCLAEVGGTLCSVEISISDAEPG